VKIALLNLISTPVPVLNSLGLDVSVGLSSEDPIGGRRPSEAFDAFLTIYGADGRLVERRHLGEIPPHRRRTFDVTSMTRPLVKDDHLVVAHRIPSRLLAGGRDPGEVIELSAEDGEFAMYRSVVQYAFPGGSNGSVIYETPPSFNVPRPGRAPASTLTFTSKIVASKEVETALALIHYSVDPAYAQQARYAFALFAPDGEEVGAGNLTMAPASVGLVRVREALAPGALARCTGGDGLAWLGYVGYSTDAAIIPLILTLAPSRGSVSVEHTHPAQAYTLPAKAEDKHKVKGRAVSLWAQRLTGSVR
jgi:hypothetical protein